MQLFLPRAVAFLIVGLWVCAVAHTLLLLPQDNSENELIQLSQCFSSEFSLKTTTSKPKTTTPFPSPPSHFLEVKLVLGSDAGPASPAG